MTRPSPPPPPAAKCPTTIHDLDDDLLREVFLRLPALPTLVRAALACRSFLGAVRSSPAFRRRFRDPHPSPFVGLFIQPLVRKWEPGVPSFNAHHRRTDRDFAAAVRGGDFALNGLSDPDDDDEDEDCGDQAEDEEDNDDEDEDCGDQDEDEEDNDDDDEDCGDQDEDEGDNDEEDEGEEEDPSPVWEIERCSDGYVVLFNRRARQIAAYNPLTRALHLFPSPPGIFKSALTFQFHMISSSSEDPGSPPRVVCFYCGFLYATVGVISPGSTEIDWQIFPEALIPGAVGATGKMVNGSLYWTHPGTLYITVLNTATLRFSRMDLPPLLGVEEGSNRECDFVIGNTKDGRPCIVSPDPWGGCELLVFFWRPDEYDGVERWMLDQEFKLETIRGLTEVEDDAYGCYRWNRVPAYRV